MVYTLILMELFSKAMYVNYNEWKNDKQHGEGREIWPDGASYTG